MEDWERPMPILLEAKGIQSRSRGAAVKDDMALVRSRVGFGQRDKRSLYQTGI
jgi:hypothetical protein